MSPFRVHLDVGPKLGDRPGMAACSVASSLNTTTVLDDVTCRRCRRVLNREVARAMESARRTST